MTIGIVFSSILFLAARFFESSGVAQWYFGTRMMNRAPTMILVRQSELCKGDADNGMNFGMLDGEWKSSLQAAGRASTHISGFGGNLM